MQSTEQSASSIVKMDSSDVKRLLLQSDTAPPLVFGDPLSSMADQVERAKARLAAGRESDTVLVSVMPTVREAFHSLATRSSLSVDCTVRCAANPWPPTASLGNTF
jgi:hypothetical protein